MLMTKQQPHRASTKNEQVPIAAIQSVYSAFMLKPICTLIFSMIFQILSKLILVPHSLLPKQKFRTQATSRKYYLLFCVIFITTTELSLLNSRERKSRYNKNIDDARLFLMLNVQTKMDNNLYKLYTISVLFLQFCEATETPW